MKKLKKVQPFVLVVDSLSLVDPPLVRLVRQSYDVSITIPEGLRSWGGEILKKRYGKAYGKKKSGRKETKVVRQGTKETCRAGAQERGGS